MYNFGFGSIWRIGQKIAKRFGHHGHCWQSVQYGSSQTHQLSAQSFYSSHAQVDTTGRWLASHAFDEALPGHAEAAHTFLNALHSIMAELTE